MSLKIVFLADSHLGFDYPIRKPNPSRRGENFFRNFKKVLDHARRIDADLVIHGGDLFNRSQPHPSIIDRCYFLLQDFVNSSGIPIVIVPGNHERGKLPPSLFLNNPNIYVFDSPKNFIFDLKGLKIGLSGFPFMKGDVRAAYPAIQADLLKGLKDCDLRFMCLHHAVDGAYVVHYTFYNRADTINKADLSPYYQAFLSGHIHRRQTLWTKEQVPFVYPGSIEKTSRQELDEEKGFYVVNVRRDLSMHWQYQLLPSTDVPMSYVAMERQLA